MNSPVYISTSSDVERYVILGQTKESLYLDFKKEIVIDTDKHKIAQELALDICSFANSFGGSIVVGIEEGKDSIDNMNFAQSFVGINNGDNVEQFISDSVLEYIYPSNIKYECKSIKIKDSVTLLAINIFPLEQGIAAVHHKSEANAIKFPYRTDYNKKYMKPYQVEERIMNNSRSLLLRMKRLQTICHRGVDLHSPIYLISKGNRALIKNAEVTLKTISDSEFTLFFSQNTAIKGVGMNLVVPYSLLFDIWEMDYFKMGMILRANILLDPDNNNTFIEPIGISRI
ncbi:ATP-binding protein [candidate division TA06 bacterium]|nr:ATP-binding protein [candidate division TA06 bacterium]